MGGHDWHLAYENKFVPRFDHKVWQHCFKFMYIYVYAHDLCRVLVFADIWLQWFTKTYETLYI